MKQIPFGNYWYPYHLYETWYFDIIEKIDINSNTNYLSSITAQIQNGTIL